ncbi:MAG: Eco47II family restriction endonuclease [Patescibacteria group bacterium]|nr:MAG: Eco47II family restriction endonuclease [Patescibacteria group bacterium]
MNYSVPKKQLLPFIGNEDLYKNVEVVLNVANRTIKEAEDLYKNSIDPFSALFDVVTLNLNFSDWLIKERGRQSQKTIQNALGSFHQEILGSISGCESLGKGKVIDLVNHDKKIIAEVKNKYNTTKGNHKTAVYDDLKKILQNEYNGYTGYYVEIIPRAKKEYDKEFTPPDNKTKKRRPTNVNIRVIDGKSFYALLSGDKDALKKLYYIIPDVIGDILGVDIKEIKNEKVFRNLFDVIY